MAGSPEQESLAADSRGDASVEAGHSDLQGAVGPGRRLHALWAGPLLGALIGLWVGSAGLGRDAALTAGLTVTCALWWMLEPVSLAATGLVPLAALPLLGVVSDKDVAGAYGHPLILLLMAGLLLSSALEHCGAHRRLALMMVRLVGGGTARRLVLGFMLASASLSLWISNTATALMLMPVALAIVDNEPASRRRALSVPLLTGIAYGASIGGIGTPIGTPPNVLFMALFEEATGRTLTFSDWMVVGLPVVVVLLPVAWLVVCRSLGGQSPERLPEPGPWRPSERRVLAVFVVTALLWITRVEPAGGWTGLLGVAGVGDSTVGLAAVVALLVLPSGEGGEGGQEQGRRLLTWSVAERVPWGLLLLFAGGLALARAFSASGLSAALGTLLSGAAGWPTLLLMLVLAVSVSFLTEVTSNTATAAVLLPVLAAAAKRAGVEPEMLMVPAVLSASCAFMLPVATAPNAIVFSSRQLEATSMARTGYRLNLLAALAIALVCYALLPF